MTDIPVKHLEFIGIRYPAGLTKSPCIMFGTPDRTERFYFQATSGTKDWYGFTTYVDINGNETDKSETCFYMAALSETFTINLIDPDWNCPAAEDLRKWLLEQTTNPVMPGIQRL